MQRLRNNVIANYAGTGWVVLMSFLFVPVYIHFLGMESYGLIGFFVSLQAVLSLLDMGLGAAINRELARLSVTQGSAQEMRHLLRTLEIVYWSAAVCIAFIVFAIAPLVASTWLHPANLSQDAVREGIILMGLAFAARWPFALYSGALNGAQQQVALNVLRASIETLRGGGAALVVMWFPTLEAFLIWQVSVGLLGSLAAAVLAWRSLPASNRSAGFQGAQLRRIWRFAVGMSGISLTVVALTQADKIVLSRILSLEDFGYYTLAWAVGGALGQLVSPIFTAFSPRLAQEVALGDEDAIRRTYQLGAQWLAGVILPVGATLAVFSREILQMWTRNPVIAERSHVVMSIVIAGTCLNALMNMPYALQLAYGWTRLTLITNVIAMLLVVPMVLLATSLYGMVGAASVWVLLNLAYVAIPVQIMHGRLLKGEKWTWYRYGAAVPAAVAVAVVLSCRFLMPADLSLVCVTIAIAAALALAIAATTLAMPITRAAIHGWFVTRWFA